MRRPKLYALVLWNHEALRFETIKYYANQASAKRAALYHWLDTHQTTAVYLNGKEVACYAD
jgi:hypothetical protein